MSATKKMSRRGFVGNAATAGALGLAAPQVISATALARHGRVGANEKLRVGLIGAGGMGRGNLANCARHDDVVVTGICDVWKQRRDATVAKYKATAKGYQDFREMLEQDDVDAVIIATPPHWHFLQAAAACQAGKDIYLQKPMTLHLAECLALRKIVKQTNRVSQIGTQIHAGENYRRVVERIRAGNLGKVNVVRTFNVMNQGPGGLGSPPDGAPPAGLDWDAWMGPARAEPFNPLIVRSAYENCSFMRYSGGWTPGMAPHIIDLPFWALELGTPTVTTCSGGRYCVQDRGDAPDTQEVLWQFPGLTMTWWMSTVNSYAFDFGSGKPARRLGIYFHGVDGTMFCDYSKHQVVPEGDRMKEAKVPEKSIPSSPGHEREWLNCIRTRQQPSCSVEYHYKIDVALTLANLSMKIGRSVQFDPKTETIVNDAEASSLAVPEYRDPWKFPDQFQQV